MKTKNLLIVIMLMPATRNTKHETKKQHQHETKIVVHATSNEKQLKMNKQQKDGTGIKCVSNLFSAIPLGIIKPTSIFLNLKHNDHEIISNNKNKSENNENQVYGNQQPTKVGEA